MAQSIWQHRLTTLSVVAYAITGKEGADRVPKSGSTPKGRVDPSVWKDATLPDGRWNLATRDANGNIVPVAPTLTPEDDEKMKNAALAKLFGVQRKAATSKIGGRMNTLPKVAGQDPSVLDPEGAFTRSLERATDPSAED